MKRILCLLPLLALVACEGKRDDHSKVLAKIGSTSFSQDDFNFMLNTLSADKITEINKDPEARRRQFNFLLKQKLQSLGALNSKYGKMPGLSGRLDLVDQRLVTQYMYQTFLGENDGISTADLKNYYLANTSKFADDSGKVKPFDAVHQRVADSVVVSKAPLDSFYKANEKKYLQKAFCDLSYILTSNKKTADEAHKALTGGISFTAAVEKYSTHASSKANHGKLGRVIKGEANWDLGQNFNTDSALFAEGTKIKVGNFSAPIKKDSTYFIIKVDSAMESSIPTLDKIKKQVADDYLQQYKSKLSDGFLASLKTRYNVKLKMDQTVITDDEIKKYYETHKENYMSAETYDMYHIESKNNGLLTKKLKDIKDLDGFKKLATQITENTWTKPDQGHIGFIKRDHCLPDGIGMMPTLFTSLDTMKSGLVKGTVQNPDTKKWHSFWLVAKQPKQVKDFDRVSSVVKQDCKSEKVTQIKPNDTLVTFGKGQVFQEKDILFLQLEIPANMQERYTREALTDFMLTWKLSNMYAEELGVTGDIKLMAQREENKITYWSQIYQDSVISKNAGLDTATLKKTFEANRDVFTKDSGEKDYRRFVRDIAAYLALGPTDMDLEFQTNPERYKKDTLQMSFSEAKYEVFQNIKGLASTKAEEKLLEQLEREFQVVILDPTLLPEKIKNPQEAYKQAQNMHYDRKLDMAIELYQRVRNEFPKVESLQDSICFGLAQIYIEQEKYQQALAEYHRLSYLYPKSANNYKAMFMVGFIQAEHLKNDSLAVRAFEKMLKQYPSSDLSDDADWMIRNIRSGGKLMPVLEGDSTATTAPADTVKAKMDTSKAKAGPTKAAVVKPTKAVSDTAKAAPKAKNKPTKAK